MDGINYWYYNKMKLLYIGEETRNWVMRLVNELSLLGHTVTAVVKRHDEYDDANRVEPLQGVTVIEVDDGAYFKEDIVYKLVKDNKYDIVYGSHIIACLPVKYIADKMNIPYGVQVLDIPLDMIEIQKSRKANWEVYKKVLKDCKTMTFIHPKARDTWNMLTGQYYDDSHIITYPIYIPEEYKLSGLDNDNGYIVSFCRVVPFRNVSQATKSLAQLKGNTKQIIVGKNQGGIENIMVIANKYGVKAKYATQVTEVQKLNLIKNASLLVHPQLSEHLGGLSPWEAMYIGTPTLCYDYDQLKGLYKEHSFYANRGVPESYTHMIAYLLSIKKEFIKNKLIKASDYAATNTYANAARKFDKILKTMRRSQNDKTEENNKEDSNTYRGGCPLYSGEERE